MTCPQCNSEMSKKWYPSATKRSIGSVVAWACSVCGYELTQADTKLSAKPVPAPLAPTTN